MKIPAARSSVRNGWPCRHPVRACSSTTCTGSRKTERLSSKSNLDILRPGVFRPFSFPARQSCEERQRRSSSPKPHLHFALNRSNTFATGGRMRFRALSPPRIQIRGKSHAANVASERGRAAELRRTRARRDDQMHRLTPSTTRFTCCLPNASMNSAIFWNGWPMPSRRTNRQSARKSTATGGASVTFTQSALSITCSRKCSSPGPRRSSGNKYSN
jgi:hypothetical protein